MPPRIYLDNAATSFPKPESVYAAIDEYNRRLGAPLGRGAYRESMSAAGIVGRCRKRAAELFTAEAPEQIVFTFNATDSLNLALAGLLQPGDHVVTSAAEHNSLLRPLRALEDRCGIAISRVPVNVAGRIEPADIRKQLRPETRLVAVMHASNVTGTLQPIDDIGAVARQAGALLLVDAAQTAGQVAINLARSPIDLLACAGHKGLLGPLGTGLLYIRPGVEDRVPPLRRGGTGTHGDDDRQPETLPEKYEAGNLNAPGLAGLEAGLAWLQSRGVDAVRNHELELLCALLEGLAGIPRVQCYGSRLATERVGVASFTIDGYDPQVAAAILDESFGIQARAGLHCAPGMHRALGTLAIGGTVRLSVGPFNTAAHIAAAVSAVREIAASA